MRINQNRRSRFRWLFLFAGLFQSIATGQEIGSWEAIAPRDEIRPEMTPSTEGGRSGSGSLVIQADERPGLHGYWTQTVPVKGGEHYRFDAWRKETGVTHPRRSIVARVIWESANGRLVANENPMASRTVAGRVSRNRPEHPGDCETDAQGWTHLRGVYRVPSAATQAVIELHLMWAPNSRVEWSDIGLSEVSSPPKRIVRLATVHYQPKSGVTNAEKCEQFAPFLQQAAQQNADLVVLPETLTYYDSGRSMSEAAESIPGPSTQYFGKLAKQHDLYIVAGLLEREQHVVYNVAVLIGPDGDVVGKYRKVCLPREEIEKGICPGNQYPVFDTRFGKVGLMVCYDGFFPEVARELSNAGAEVIAWPVWGCNPQLAKARAIENSVYLISSTYTDASADWTHSSIYGHDGSELAWAKKWGTIGVAEVDLNDRIHWPFIGDFKAALYRHRPATKRE